MDKAQQEFECRPQIAQFATVVAWLRDKGLSSARIASLLRCFNPTENHIRQLAARGRNTVEPRIELSLNDPLPPPADSIRDIIGIRRHDDTNKVDRDSKSKLKNIEKLEAEVESAAAHFWEGVRFARQMSCYRNLLVPIGKPAHPRLIRLKARVRQLLAETLLHAGMTASSIREGLRAINLSSVAYHETKQSAYDLEELGRTARLISQAYLLRGDATQTQRFLVIHRSVCERLNRSPRPEYFHQLATLALQTGSDDANALPFLSCAMEGLARLQDYGQPKHPHEILDIGERQTHFINADWENSEGLLDYMTNSFPSGDIHVAINVLWTVATGFSTDSQRVHQLAGNLLRSHEGIAEGYGRQATTYLLLGIAPELPMSLRRDFVRLALYQNAFRNF